MAALALTAIRWGDGDGLGGELVIEIPCVDLRRHLGLEWRDQLIENRRNLLASSVPSACLPLHPLKALPSLPTFF